MSRVANNPVTVPAAVEVKVEGRDLSVKGGKGALSLRLHESVSVEKEGDALRVAPRRPAAAAMAGTTRALLSNMVDGVTKGFEKRLTLNGVGYRCAVQGSKLNLTLGFSHPVVFELPKGISAEAPSQTEIVLKGIDKQAVGQAAAEIRAFRPPEPYKGKGISYADERVRRKEAKKK